MLASGVGTATNPCLRDTLIGSYSSKGDVRLITGIVSANGVR
jgi:hypothetical protein